MEMSWISFVYKHFLRWIVNVESFFFIRIQSTDRFIFRIGMRIKTLIGLFDKAFKRYLDYVPLNWPYLNRIQWIEKEKKRWFLHSKEVEKFTEINWSVPEPEYNSYWAHIKTI